MANRIVTMERRSIILGSASCSLQGENISQDANIEAATPPQVLVLRSRLEEDDDDNDSLDASISSLSQDEQEREDEQPPSVSSPCKPRSIFESYWKTEGESPCPKERVPPSRSISPMSVTVDPYSQQSYSHTMDMLLLEPALEEKDDGSLNTYERTLKDCEVLDWRLPNTSPYENAPLWMSWFTKRNASAPSFLGMQGARCLLTRTRQTQSDSALHTTPLKSALRRGRFGALSSAVKPVSCARKTARVHFQPRIEVCSYRPTVESWAPQGWSQWFGL